MDESLFSTTFVFVQNIFKDNHDGHDFAHTQRVYQMAMRIAKKENADLNLVGLSALLHDVDDRKLFGNTSEELPNAKSFLISQNVNPSQIETILSIIKQVSFVGKDSVIPDSIEGKCVQDADRLDALGAIGIARTFAFGGSHNRILYDPDIPPAINMDKEQYYHSESTTINHFYEKLFLLKDMLSTKTAKEIAEHRDQFMHDFISEFLCEWNGEK